MARQKATTSVRSIVGTALVGLGLVLLFSTIDGPAAAFNRWMGLVAKAELELVACVLPAAAQHLAAHAFDLFRFAACREDVSTSIGPLLHLIAGIA